MKKKDFVSLLLGVVGGLLFALGLCMCLLPEWNAFQPGIVVAALGALVLLVLVMVRRKMEGKPAIEVNGKTVLTVVLAAVGALVLGFGMCLVMVWQMLVQGILLGIVGIALLLCLIPLCKGLQ